MPMAPTRILATMGPILLSAPDPTAPVGEAVGDEPAAAVAELNAEDAALGFVAVLASTVSMMCTTPLEVVMSDLTTLAVELPEVTNNPVAFWTRVNASPDAEVNLPPLNSEE